MSRILFVDDRESRRRWARENLDDPGGFGVLEADTVDVAVFYLGAYEFDVVYLDHDMGSETPQDSADPTSGMEVVRWVEANRPKVGRFVVHTHNDAAATEMVARLRKAGYETEYKPFMRMYYEAEGRTK